MKSLHRLAIASTLAVLTAASGVSAQDQLTPDATNPLIVQGAPGTWDEGYIDFPSAVQQGSTTYVFYTGGASLQLGPRIGLASSTDGVTFAKDAANPILRPTDHSWDSAGVHSPVVIKDSSGDWIMLYEGTDGTGRIQIGRAVSTSGPAGPYVKDPSPVLTVGAQGEERLLALYARLRGWLYLAILVAQLSLTARLYRRIGIPLAIVASPLIYLLGFLGLSVRLSLSTGVGALVGARLQDKSVYDPGTHILFNLFPEDLRSWATGLLEGPIKRMGGVLGNAATYAAVQAGGAGWVGFAALPAAVVWLGIALLLWRTYPELLLRSAFRRDRFGDAPDVAELLDPGTVRALGVRLEDPDPARCRAAIALVSEARRDLAVGVLAEAVRKAPASTLRLLVPALDRLLEEAVTEPMHDPQAARRPAERWQAGVPGARARS